MKTTLKKILSSSILLVLFSASMPQNADALGKDDPLFRDSKGTYTVKCVVHENGTGNNNIGYVFGNHSKVPSEAERDANLFVSKFGPGHTKRHCRTQKKYTPRGAYDTSLNPI